MARLLTPDSSVIRLKATMPSRVSNSRSTVVVRISTKVLVMRATVPAGSGGTVSSDIKDCLPSQVGGRQSRNIRYMLKTTRTLIGIIVTCCGMGGFIFGFNLFAQQQSWLMLGGLVLFSSLGVALIRLGYALICNYGIKEALAFLFFIGRRTP